MYTDAQLQREVMAQLDWDPAINAAQIGVEVSDGVVTLAGHVGNFGEKWEAEQVVLRMSGVQALTVELEVNLPGASRRDDAEIARAVVHALEWQAGLPPDQVAVMVESGWVTLAGRVDWQFQRMAAERAVRSLTGVRGISDTIAVEPEAPLTAQQVDIERALLRNAKPGAHRILVRVDGSQVTLSGAVSSWADREQARHTAWSTPGVRSVVDEMRMRY